MFRLPWPFASGPEFPASAAGQVLGLGAVKPGLAHRAGQLPSGRDVHGGGTAVAVGAPVAPQPGKKEPQAVQQLGGGAKGAADAGNSGPLIL